MIRAGHQVQLLADGFELVISVEGLSGVRERGRVETHEVSVPVPLLGLNCGLRLVLLLLTLLLLLSVDVVHHIGEVGEQLSERKWLHSVCGVGTRLRTRVSGSARAPGTRAFSSCS